MSHLAASSIDRSKTVEKTTLNFKKTNLVWKKLAQTGDPSSVATVMVSFYITRCRFTGGIFNEEKVKMCCRCLESKLNTYVNPDQNNPAWQETGQPEGWW